MSKLSIPFNIKLLNMTPAKLQGVSQITSQDIFDTNGNFHEEGLFSSSIFGRVGDELRDARFAYIDLKIDIFHPVILRALTSLKRLYGGIISGKEYAVWDDETKDFVRSDPVNGKTGFYFFLSKWNEINFERNKSITRLLNIEAIEKYKGNGDTTSVVVVLPAGLRDVEVGADGRVQENELNVLYRKLIAYSNTIAPTAIKTNPELLNNTRYSIQMVFCQIYELIESLIEGKKKLFLGKWASRKIMDGTRNVLTSMKPGGKYLGDPSNISVNNTVIGLYQALKGIRPVAVHHIRNGFLSSVFTTVDAPAKLVDKKTLKSVDVHLTPDYFDKWMSNEGIEKIITSFNDPTIRHKPIEIKGYYLGLIYKGPDKTFKLLHDIDEVPEPRSKADVSPLTFVEFLYLSCYKHLGKYPIFPTRYPIAGVGSIYPSIAYVKTTVKADPRTELGDHWQVQDEKTCTAYQFPVRGDAFVNSLSPHPTKLGRLVADFDGDTGSGNMLYMDESIREVRDYLNSRQAYVGTDGKFLYSTAVDTIQLVMRALTGD